MDIMGLISNVGFPITLVLIIGAYLRDIIKTNYMDYKSREAELLAANKEFAKVLTDSSKRLQDTLVHHSQLEERMGSAEEKLDAIEHKIDVIHDKVETVKNNVDKLL